MRGQPELVKLTDNAGKLKSPYWYIRYYEGRGRRISTGYRIGAQDQEAQIALAQFILERERPTSKEPSQLMISAALKSYYEEHIQHTASRGNAPYYEAKLNSFFGGMMVSDITQGKINNYVRDGESRKLSAGTIRRQLEHLQGALNHAVREQRLTYAPKFKKPLAPAPRDRLLTDKEIARLKKACVSPHMKAFVEIMLETGQRPGAVENLTWFQVDMKQGIIHFDRTGKKQTNKRVRPVPISDNLYPLLKRLHKAKKTGFVLEYKGEHAGCVRKAFERACKKAKIKGVSRYTLRHTFVNGLYVHGVDDKTISDIAGHTNIRTTRHHYIKTNMDNLRLAVNKTAQEVRKNRKGKK